MDFRILLVFTLAITACAADDSDEDRHGGVTCALKYLKAKNLLDSNFKAKVTQSNVTESMCNDFVVSIKNLFYDNLEEEFKTDKDLAEVADCLIEKTKEVDIADLAIKSYVYGEALNMSKQKKKKAKKAIELAIEKRTENVAKVCAATETFGAIFDKICEIDSTESDEESPLEDYCIRKYMTENNFINTTIHKIDLNPTNINVTNVNCDEIVNKARAEAVDELKKEFDGEDEFASRRAKKCLSKSLDNSKYFVTAGKAVILCEITMTPEIKQYERGQFIKDMGTLYDVIYRC